MVIGRSAAASSSSSIGAVGDGGEGEVGGEAILGCVRSSSCVMWLWYEVGTMDRLGLD